MTKQAPSMVPAWEKRGDEGKSGGDIALPVQDRGLSILRTKTLFRTGNLGSSGNARRKLEKKETRPDFFRVAWNFLQRSFFKAARP
jgi:hypothetical protein